MHILKYIDIMLNIRYNKAYLFKIKAGLDDVRSKTEGLGNNYSIGAK